MKSLTKSTSRGAGVEQQKGFLTRGPCVISYGRFSDPKQAAGASKERQERLPKSVAKERGLPFDETLTMFDAGLSALEGDNLTKGQLGPFMLAVRAGKIHPGTVLVVEDFDRLSRQEPELAFAQVVEIYKAGIIIVTGNRREYSIATVTRDRSILQEILGKNIRANGESVLKSVRVTDSLRKVCEETKEGTAEKHIHAGGTPGWLRLVDGKYQLIPEQARAVREVIRLYREGFGAGHIANHLAAKGLHVRGEFRRNKPAAQGGGFDMKVTEANSGQIVRLLTRRALMGEKSIKVKAETDDGTDGKEVIYTTPNYFPALITEAEFDELQTMLASRARKGIRGELPSVLTGTKITTCGYCGESMKAQMMTSHMRDDGTLADGHRRLQCSRANKGGGCVVKGSCSSAPIERALMEWLSVDGNITSLYDASEAVNIDLAKARTAHAKAAKIHLKTLTLAGADDDDEVQELITRLRTDRDALAKQVAELEIASDEASRADSPDAASRWAELRSDVEALDFDARMKARHLVVETFKSIEVYHHGLPARKDGGIALKVRAKGASVDRLFSVDKMTGKLIWEEVDDFTTPLKPRRVKASA